MTNFDEYRTGGGTYVIPCEILDEFIDEYIIGEYQETIATIHQMGYNKELQYNRIYESTKDFGRAQFVKEIQMQINENKQLKEKNEHLERLEFKIIFELNKIISELNEENKMLKNICEGKQILRGDNNE